ncbi:unnamed protein product [Bursaphelenchus okinawaensis]|uniref:Uncharacterized protein n=1 Tax=Bursaphelenchus okinawaensis TaxID=465554 RepID=A0A811L025_9BILA|nr:unnamed protein product [Bursaphelenchus okinawaensis]CAG9113765.1 unnamed protein product [Bursaphelenchus okinawaensis]
MVPPPDDQKSFHFNFDVVPKLSMSIERDYKKLFVVDYDPDNLQWEERDNNQLAPCLAKFNLSIGLNPRNQSFFRKVDEFDTLEQFNGQHVRLHAVNGKIPSQLILTNYDSELTIRLQNGILLDSLTMRIYGLDTAWFNDGVPYLQQCPVASKSVFTYKYKVNRQGTHIYRSTQPHFRPDGFAGIMVSKKPNETLATVDGRKVPIAAEYELTIQDWPFVEANQQRQHGLSHGLSKWGHGLDRDDGQCTQGSYSGGEVDNKSVAPYTIMVNGKGWYNQEDVVTRPSRLPLTRYRITKDSYHLFRVAHLGFERALRISVEDHDITLCVVDGAHIKPVQAQSLIVLPGKVFNFYIHSKSNPNKKVYRMIVETLHEYETYDNIQQPVYGLADLVYDEVEDNGQNLDEVDFEHKICNENECIVLNCPTTSIHPNPNIRCVTADQFQDPDANDDTDMLQSKVYSSSDYEEHFISMNALTKVDGFTYAAPEGIPYFTENLKSCNDKDCNRKNVALGEMECKCFHYKQIGYNKIVQFTIYNMGPKRPGHPYLAMPVHVPSTHVYVLKMGFPTYYNNQTIKEFNKDIKCDNPEYHMEGTLQYDSEALKLAGGWWKVCVCLNVRMESHLLSK